MHKQLQGKMIKQYNGGMNKKSTGGKQYAQSGQRCKICGSRIQKVETSTHAREC